MTVGEAVSPADHCRRVAFLTPEFPTESIGSLGGLSNYLNRVSRLLAESGREVEVFVRSDRSETVEHGSVRVHRVPRSPALERGKWGRLARLPGVLRPTLSIGCLRSADALAAAFEARHAEKPFDLVQSSDYAIPGFFVEPRPGLRHIIRCSLTTSWLRGHAAKRWGIGRPHDLWLLRRLERRLFHQVDGVYAPSRRTSIDYTARYGAEVGVVRPPFFLESEAEADGVSFPNAPERYLLFVGHLNTAKGIDVLARAMAIAVRRDPGLKMVWAGGQSELADWAPLLGGAIDNVVHVGSVDKPQVYALMRRAVAVVAPSRTDNLPNVVLEAVAQGAPVIGSDGASIDEIVEPGRSGLLVPMADERALASALIEAWQGGPTWLPDGFHRPSILDEVEPHRALETLLAFRA